MSAGAAAGGSPVRLWADLARAGNFPSVASNVLTALVLSHVQADGWPAAAPWAWATVAGCLAYAGGAGLNDVADARFDRTHRPERPIPRGAVRRSTAGVLAAGQLAAGAALLLVLGAAPLRVAALVLVIAAYDWVHKRWSGSVVLMAGCRLLLALALASLPGHQVTPALLGWLGLLFLYIVGLSLLARREYRPGAPAARISRRVGQLLAAIPLLDAAALLAVSAWGPALLAAVAYPLGRLAQRVAAST